MSLLSSRREFLISTGSAAVLLAGQTGVGRATVAAEETADIPALQPRGSGGHQFVLYADSCSGVPGAANEKTFAAVNRMVARIRPRPEFIAFPGDAVMGYVEKPAELQQQWDYWRNTEMAWLKELNVPLYQSTSNHNTYDEASEEVFRKVHAELPQNGPEHAKGLAYFVRQGDLLYVSTHQPDRTKPYRHTMVMGTQWLDRVLTENKDAKYKFVAGHYPVFPVNGYFYSPEWCFRPEERQMFWDLLVKHKVQAYLCSHILAYDVQIHEGVPQILSGGAGTQGKDPWTMMPARTEYLHAVQMAVDAQGLRCQVRDVAGKVRESLTWPAPLSPSSKWSSLTDDNCAEKMSALKPHGSVIAWRLKSKKTRQVPSGESQTMLWGWDPMEGLATVWIGLEGVSSRLTVRMIPQSGYGWQLWTGPPITENTVLDLQVAIHSGLGPGGVLYRYGDEKPWQSFQTNSSKGMEDLIWPRHWKIGEGPSGPTHWPFLGNDLEITWTQESLPKIDS